MKTYRRKSYLALLAFSLLIPGCSRPMSTAEFERQNSSTSEPSPEVDKEALAKSKVVVKQDIKFEIEGNYMYLRGSVINKSSRTVEYWKLTVNFLDGKGKIIDSTFTNESQTLLPGASKRFEIMHERLSSLKDFRLNMEEVRFKD